MSGLSSALQPHRHQHFASQTAPRQRGVEVTAIVPVGAFSFRLFNLLSGAGSARDGSRQLHQLAPFSGPRQRTRPACRVMRRHGLVREPLWSPSRPRRWRCPRRRRGATPRSSARRSGRSHVDGVSSRDVRRRWVTAQQLATRSAMNLGPSAPPAPGGKVSALPRQSTSRAQPESNLLDLQHLERVHVPDAQGCAGVGNLDDLLRVR